MQVKRSFQILIFIFTFLIIGFQAFAQEPKDFNLLNDDIESMLPPLETIIDSAIANNFSIRSGDLDTRLKEYKLKADRTIWIKNLGMQTDVRYGTINNFSSNTGDGQTPTLSAIQSNSFNYGVGAFIKLPIYDIINRKNQIKSDQAEIEQAKNMAEFHRKEIRQLVIRQYNELILKYRVLKIKSKNAETSKINMQMVEKEFSNGIISVSEYASVAESISRTEADFESSRMDFLTAFMILEEIVGIKFNIIM